MVSVRWTGEIVQITVEEVQGQCPVFKVGDRLLLRNQEIVLEECTPDTLCIHALGCIYGTVLFARKGEPGIVHYAQCFDPGPPYAPEGGTVVFRIERIQ